SMRVTRAIDIVSSESLVDQAHEALSSAAAPCELRDARVPAEVRLAAGPREFRAEFPSGLRNGSVTGSLFVETGSQSARVPVVVRLACPPPEVSAGMQITARAVIGDVVASAPAEARQPGRIGEVIRITNRITGAALRGRVIDAHTVEVVP
ncbi:MAG TPA: flagella basal body P-ring formation protein FlgA, partial [Polyangiales bacterium]|nr:flagella basal body P-ring formation protein FlgA [Polyangiales bacterium]